MVERVTQRETFAKRHQAELSASLDLPNQPLPSDTTFRRVLLHVQWESLTQAFNAWPQERCPEPQGQHLASDGKSIKASVKNYNQSHQDFVSLVSLFNVQSCIRVERSSTRGNKPFSETIFYISSLQQSATEFAQRIRHHWHRENRWHWVKDVVLKEDETPLCGGNVAIAMGILRTVAVKLFRLNPFDSITQGIHNLAQDIKTLFPFFQ